MKIEHEYVIVIINRKGVIFIVRKEKQNQNKKRNPEKKRKFKANRLLPLIIKTEEI